MPLSKALQLHEKQVALMAAHHHCIPPHLLHCPHLQGCNQEGMGREMGKGNYGRGNVLRLVVGRGWCRGWQEEKAGGEGVGVCFVRRGLGGGRVRRDWRGGFEDGRDVEGKGMEEGVEGLEGLEGCV